MKTLMFAKKSLLELWRSRQIFWIYLLFPAAMVLVYYSAFGQNSGMSNYLTIVIENQDRGSLGEGLVNAIRSSQFDGKAVFTVIEGLTRQEAEIYLNEGKASLLLIIPPAFSESLLSNLTEPVKISMQGDPLGDTYAFSYSFLEELIRLYANEATGWEKELPVSQEFLPNTGTLNDFQIAVPGLIIFGVMFGVITVALFLTNEKSNNTIRRIKLSNARASHLFGGVTLAGIVLSIIQMVITLAAAILVGYKPVGSIFLIILIGVISSLSATGAGMIAACLAKTEGEATGYGTGFLVPLVFLSGAVYPMPKMTLFKIGEVSVQSYDIIPSTHATQAISKVMLYGEGISGIGYEMIMLAILTTILLLAGILLYQKKVLDK